MTGDAEQTSPGTAWARSRGAGQEPARKASGAEVGQSFLTFDREHRPAKTILAPHGAALRLGLLQGIPG
jgi:hypothetical protein